MVMLHPLELCTMLSRETVSVGLLNLADTRLQHYNLYNTMSLSRFRFLFALRFEVSP